MSITCFWYSHFFHKIDKKKSRLYSIITIGHFMQKEDNKVIEAIGLVKKYGDHVAVDHLDFTVEKGQVLGFLGPNGAGKSTTMNMLTGYISSTEGTIIVNGYDMLEEAEEAKKSIGYLPEQPPLYPDMTVKEYLKFVTELKQVPKKERTAEIERVIGLTKIDVMRNRLIRHLSKGYKQRVGIAQAMIGNPEVIILDEPTVGLDPAQIIEIRELIRDLAKEHTVLLSSHIMQEISAVCDHIMIICHGKLILSGTLEELQKQAEEGENLEVSVYGTKEQLAAVVKDFSGITEVTYMDGETPESSAVRLKSERDIRKEFSAALAKAGLPIEKLVRHVKTLEDIFLEATAAADEEYLRSLEEEEEYEEEEDVEAGAGEEEDAASGAGEGEALVAAAEGDKDKTPEEKKEDRKKKKFLENKESMEQQEGQK